MYFPSPQGAEPDDPTIKDKNGEVCEFSCRRCIPAVPCLLGFCETPDGLNKTATCAANNCENDDAPSPVCDGARCEVYEGCSRVPSNKPNAAAIETLVLENTARGDFLTAGAPPTRVVHRVTIEMVTNDDISR